MHRDPQDGRMVGTVRRYVHGFGQDDAGQADAVDPADAAAGRVDRNNADLQFHGTARGGPAADGAATVSRAASYDQQRRAGRGWFDTDAGRERGVVCRR